jgi:hypothetical protein
MQHLPRDTLRQLWELFPDFEDWWKEEETEDVLVDGVHCELTHHRVMMEFLGFFAKHHKSFTEKQLRSFGDWVNRVVSRNDDLENAVSTCFLEHSHQVRIDRILAPYLSRQAKGKSHA